jgi:hypothetical protein
MVTCPKNPVSHWRSVWYCMTGGGPAATVPPPPGAGEAAGSGVLAAGGGVSSRWPGRAVASCPPSPAQPAVTQGSPPAGGAPP